MTTIVAGFEENGKTFICSETQVTSVGDKAIDESKIHFSKSLNCYVSNSGHNVLADFYIYDDLPYRNKKESLAQYIYKTIDDYINWLNTRDLIIKTDNGFCLGAYIIFASENEVIQMSNYFKIKECQNNEFLGCGSGFNLFSVIYSFANEKHLNKNLFQKIMNSVSEKDIYSNNKIQYVNP